MTWRLSALVVLLLMVTNCTGRSSSIPGTGVVLPQPTGTPADASPATRPAQPPAGTRHALVEVRIPHVHELAEILVTPGDQVTHGQPLARLQGYAEELAVDVALAEAELTQAQAALTQARRRLAAEAERVAIAHEETLAEADAQVKKAERQVAALERERDRAGLRLTLAQTRTAYRQRWVAVLEPLAQHDPWNDLPFLVGVTSVDGVKRTDLNYREAMAKALYDRQLAELEQALAEAELADTLAQLEVARQDVDAAVGALEHLLASPTATTEDNTAALEAAVQAEELRVARARGNVEATMVRSLVTGRVLEVQVERVDGNQATILIRILTETAKAGDS